MIGAYYFGMWSAEAFQVIDGFPFRRRDFYLRASSAISPVYAWRSAAGQYLSVARNGGDDCPPHAEFAGAAFYLATDSGGDFTEPVYHLRGAERHLFTADLKEKDSLCANGGYSDAGVLGYLCPRPAPGLVPLYSWKHANGTRHLTAGGDTEGIDAASGYTREGAIGYVPGERLRGDDWWTGVRDLFDKTRCWPANPGEITDEYLGVRGGDFSHLQPAIGYYDLRNPETIRRHIAQARASGLEFFTFYWYWNSYTRKEELNAGLESFLAVPDSPLKFAIAVCEHGGPFVLWGDEETAARQGAPQSVPPNFDVAIARMVGYVRKENYLRTSGGRPLIYLLDLGGISNRKLDGAGKVVGDGEPQGNAIATFVTRLRSEVMKAVGCQPFLVMGISDKVYPYRKPDGSMGTVSVMDFADAGTELAPGRGLENLTRSEKKLKVPLLPGFTQNFDERPRYGCIKPGGCLYDGTDSFRKNFRRDLAEVKSWMDAQPRAECRILSIYAWNEWHEGGIIEPNVRDGAKYLGMIQDVFQLPAGGSPID